MKKIISLFLSITLILCSIPYSFAVLSPSDMQIVQPLIDSGMLPTNGAGRDLSAQVYQKYGLGVYGSPWGSTDKRGEYRYLGYDYDDRPITNDNYTNDATSNVSLTQKNWITFDAAIDSWKAQLQPEQIYHLLHYDPLINDGSPLNLSITDILARKATSDTARKSYTQMQVAPSLSSGGSAKLKHKTSSGAVYYDTFNVPSLGSVYGFDPAVGIDTQDTYTLAPNQTTLDVPVTVSGDIGMNNAPSGKTPEQIVNNITLKFEGVSKKVPSNNRVATYTKTINASSLKVGSNKVTLTGYGNFKSIYGDSKDASGVKTITVIKPNPTTPTLNVTASASPESIQFNNADVPVKITANAELLSYSNTPNIKEVKFYARFKEDVAAQEKLIATSALSASATFDFVIPKAKVTSDNYVQEFVVTAVYYFKTPISTQSGNVSSIQGTTETNSLVYKQTPPPPAIGEKPPIADILTEKVVQAGDDVSFSGSPSYDPDGTITDYNWSIPGLNFNSGNSGERVTGWFSNPGSTVANLMVTDNDGNTDDDNESITILPPKPSLIVKTYGTVKENRKITLDMTQSRTPAHYPLLPDQTTVSITPVSGGTASDIKYNGSLNGSLKLDVLFKKTGVYRVQAIIKNTSGYSDTVTIDLNVVPDLAPKADFAVQSIALRDPNDGNKSTLIYSDQSFSTDNDYIASNEYTITYDFNNNGVEDDAVLIINSNDFADGETKSTLAWGQNLDITVSKPQDAPIVMSLKGQNVGKYKAELKATEGFGQETILEFISASDYRTDDTSDKLDSEKRSEIKNVAPSVSLELTKRRPYDFVIVTDYTGSKLTDLQSQLNSFKAEMLGESVDVKFTYINTKKKIGQQSKVVTNYLYARRAWVSYIETGYEDILNRNPTRTTWTNRPNTTYGYYEQVWGDIPNPLPKFSKSSTWQVTTQSYDDRGTYGQNRGTKYIFYDPSNFSGTQIGINLDTYADGAFWGMRSNAYSNITYGMDTSWTNTGYTQQKTLYYDIYGIDFTPLNTLAFRNGAEKVMMVFSDSDSTDYSYTNPYGTGYTLATLTNTIKDFVVKNNMAVYTVVSDPALDLKFNANQNSTNINTQQVSLRELANASPQRYKYLTSANWYESMQYIKFVDLLKMGTVNIENNTVRIKLTDPADSSDLLLNYIEWYNGLSDEIGNALGSFRDVLVTNITGKNATPDLYYGLVFEDTIGAVNNGKTTIRLGSPSVSGNTFRYLIWTDEPMNTPYVGYDATTWTAISNGQTIVCPNDVYIGVVEVDSANRLVRFSQSKAVTIDEQ